MCVIVKKVAKNVKGWKCLKMGRGDFFEFEWGIRHIVGKHACALALSGRCRIGRQDGIILNDQYDPEVDRARARRPQTIRPLRMTDGLGSVYLDLGIALAQLPLKPEVFPRFFFERQASS